jgi:hypothetical protein
VALACANKDFMVPLAQMQGAQTIALVMALAAKADAAAVQVGKVSNAS